MKIKISLLLLLATFNIVNGQSYQLSTAIQKSLSCVFAIKTFDINNEEIGLGTGFFIDSIGTGITNYHVLQGANSATVYLHDGSHYEILYIQGEDKNHDIIRFVVSKPETDHSKIKFLSIATKQPILGEEVFTIGNPKGLSFSVSNGIISSVRNDKDFGEIIQTTAPISKGCSGSPLLNLKGEVIGVISFYFVEGQNLNFAFSSKYIKKLTTASINFNFPKKDLTRKISDLEDNIFKRYNWRTTQYAVRSTESLKLISDEVNSATSQPELKYSCLLFGMPFDLTYEFEGGKLSEIIYSPVLSVSEIILRMFGSLDNVLNIFQILYGEITTRFGEEIGCWRGSTMYIEYDKEPTQEECISVSLLNEYYIRSEAKKEFEKFDAEKMYESFVDYYFYKIFWRSNSSEYVLIMNFHRKYKDYYPSEACCFFVIKPLRN